MDNSPDGHRRRSHIRALALAVADAQVKGQLAEARERVSRLESQLAQSMEESMQLRMTQQVLLDDLETRRRRADLTQLDGIGHVASPSRTMSPSHTQTLIVQSLREDLERTKRDLSEESQKRAELVAAHTREKELMKSVVRRTRVAAMREREGYVTEIARLAQERDNAVADAKSLRLENMALSAQLAQMGRIMEESTTGDDRGERRRMKQVLNDRDFLAASLEEEKRENARLRERARQKRHRDREMPASEVERLNDELTQQILTMKRELEETTDLLGVLANSYVDQRSLLEDDRLSKHLSPIRNWRAPDLLPDIDFDAGLSPPSDDVRAPRAPTHSTPAAPRRLDMSAATSISQATAPAVVEPPKPTDALPAPPVIVASASHVPQDPTSPANTDAPTKEAAAAEAAPLPVPPEPTTTQQAEASGAEGV